MTTIDLTPLYRNTIGFDRLASLLQRELRAEKNHPSYPPYSIEAIDDSHYAISLVVAGFTQDELDIEVNRDTLTVKGNKAGDDPKRQYLYQGFSTNEFECKFNLADHVEVSNAKLDSGILTIDLHKEIPEEMRPKRIEIHAGSKILEHKSNPGQAA